MFTMFNGYEVFWAIILFVAVYVMNVFAFFRQSSIGFSPDISMFKDIAARESQRMIRHAKYPITMLIQTSLPLRCWMTRACGHKTHMMPLNKPHRVSFPLISRRLIIFCNPSFLSATATAKPIRRHPIVGRPGTLCFLHTFEGIGSGVVAMNEPWRGFTFPFMPRLFDDFLSAAAFTFCHAI